MTNNQKGAMGFNPSYGYLGSYTPDNLLNGDFDRVRSTFMVDGENLKRGSIFVF